ncbi:MAG: hypothetical protein JWP06_761 [Candidatus Saccharibacteria bacterium]|nr:hypothetical protein [Candidatus Saccharibacteria bacterium]
MVGGERHEHIAEVKYIDADGTRKKMTRQQAVEWLDASSAHVAVVYSQDRRLYAYVETVHRLNAPDYIRTQPDSTGADNLLALLEY